MVIYNIKVIAKDYFEIVNSYSKAYDYSQLNKFLTKDFGIECQWKQSFYKSKTVFEGEASGNKLANFVLKYPKCISYQEEIKKN